MSKLEIVEAYVSRHFGRTSSNILKLWNFDNSEFPKFDMLPFGDFNSWESEHSEFIWNLNLFEPLFQEVETLIFWKFGIK